MATTTPNYNLILPAVNDPTDQDLWGGYLNTDLDMIDSLLKSATFTSTTSLSSNTTLDTTYINKIILVDATGGNITLTLPAAATAGNGFQFGVIKTDASANTVTIKPNGAETINGVANIVMVGKYSSLNVICDSTTWFSNSSQLPSQSGNNGKLLSTDGSNGFWASFNISRQVITSNGTYTKPAGLMWADVEVVGGGAAALNNGSVSQGSPGGAAGGYAKKVFAASAIGATETCTIGLGGTTAAQSGGTTSFGSLLTATGGDGALAGLGGIGSLGDINLRGGPGGPGSQGPAGGDGGSNVLGFGGRGAATGAGGAQTNGTGYGGGGGGGVSNVGPIGAGSNGVIIVTEYKLN